jgi:anion-transporting  ArsA/GET3 family ATPase
VSELRSASPVVTLPELAGVEGPDRVRALAIAMEAGHGPVAEVGASRTGQARTTTNRTPNRRGRAVRAPVVESLWQHLEGARIIVTCGSGGVGKTTVSAAMAIGLADAGRETALLTVDPARRLASALRLPAIAGDRTRVPLGRGRSMQAIQLDTQRTFDELIERHAGSVERRDAILANRYYRRIADTLSGTHEYMAMEKLFELATEETHQAIVVDTPPTRSALSFLDAPRRLNDFLGGRLLRMLLWPSARAGRLGLGVARVGAAAFTRTIGRLVGRGVLTDVVDFLSAFEGMYGGFKQRAADVHELLRSPECAFVVVSVPDASSLEEAAFFVERLGEGGMRAAALVVNRWHPEAAPLPRGADTAIGGLAGGTAEQRAVAAVLSDRLRREPRHILERVAVDAFAQRHPELPIVAVPELAGDVHDVPGLRRVGAQLFGSTG